MTRVIACVRVGRSDVTVEVTKVFKTRDGRRVAVIKALPVNGQPIYPFMNCSILKGTPTTDTTSVLLDQLRGLSIVETGSMS